MNMFKAFESRIAEAFGASQQGYAAPFSFRKLAKRAAKEMEQETYVIDGVDTAPALITILVSADDDSLMRTLYPQLTEEVANFVEAEAAQKGYVFVGKPLARFMVDPSLRRGRFAVFANNVDAMTLEKLRQEEIAFLAGFGSLGGAASPDLASLPDDEPVAHPSHRAVAAAPVAVAEPAPEPPSPEDSLAGLSALPEDYEEPLREASAPKPAVNLEIGSLASAIPEVIDPQENPIVTPVAEVVSAQVPEIPEVEPLPAAPAAIAVPATVRREVPNVGDSTVSPAPVPVAEKDPVTCLLIDRQSGRTYAGTAPRTLIGRERTQGGIVLHDPNVSRRHAELTYDGRVWRIHDLDSTNGTLVNDVDVETCVLRDGDLITLGLLNLEFRES